MSTDNYTIRSMNRSEVDLAIAWAAAEGWNPGKYDAESFYQVDKNGFLLGELNGEPVGCISAMAYDQYYGFIGFYIVQPQFRGRGFGLKLWQAAMAYLGTDRNIGLDGLIVQQENYQKSGFKIAYNHIRYETLGGGVVPPGVVELRTLPFAELVADDRQLFPAERSQFLQTWIQQPESFALGVLSNGHLVGYGVIRASHTGFRIGPLFANDEQIAETLFQALLAKCPDAPVFLDIPDANPQANALVQRHRMKRVFEAARMYTKTIPSFPINRVFGVTSLELG
ncbi:acetyltransferase [Cylindrospermum stagnale PCC 7417]|uniref:Acetyltransferase n=1 Tax=Cylindrospermum stagnale PCC 7417 TaxID=56107 RepID=K9WT53_9NOST|nr:GNAT family N-acetyltransferase [Cylindrospermum stagnale]AFZ22961.1 acetyltransferase [Cylindrospermum stagnale PCC 7417]